MMLTEGLRPADVVRLRWRDLDVDEERRVAFFSFENRKDTPRDRAKHTARLTGTGFELLLLWRGQVRRGLVSVSDRSFVCGFSDPENSTARLNMHLNRMFVSCGYPHNFFSGESIRAYKITIAKPLGRRQGLNGHSALLDQSNLTGWTGTTTRGAYLDSRYLQM